MSVGGHEALQLFDPVLDDDEAGRGAGLVRGADRLDHQKPLAVGRHLVRPADEDGCGADACCAIVAELVGAAVADATLAGSSRTNSATEMSPMRRLRSFSRHRRISVRTDAGTSAGSAAQSGSPRSTAASLSLTSSASVGPSTGSITSAVIPPLSSRPWICAMFG